MSITVCIDEARLKLKEMITMLGFEDEIIITENNKPIARLVAAIKPQARFGSCKGMLRIVAEDNDHLKDFEDYMS